MTSQQDIPLYEEVVNGFEQLADKVSVGETSALRQIRRHAFENFRQSGFPSIRNEDWKYTNLTRFLKDEYALNLPGSGNVATAAVPSSLLENAKIADFDC